MSYSIQRGDIFIADCDVIVVPQSTNDVLSTAFKAGIQSFSLGGIPIRKSLGDVMLVEVPYGRSTSIKYVAFVCTVEDGKSSYAALRKIGFRLMKEVQEVFAGAPFKIAIPQLSEDVKQLPIAESLRILYSACKEAAQTNFDLIFLTPNEDVFNELKKLAFDTEPPPSIVQAFRASVRAASENPWVLELANDPEFYFGLATDKFQEFLNFQSPYNDFFSVLAKLFVESGTTFQIFLRQLPQDSSQYRFLILCGELVAYIDKNAYNKNEWNKYPDKRIIAKSAVRQTNWIKNLLNYRINNNNLYVLSPSIKNAIKYLQSPSTQLTVLSENHRRLLYKNILNVDYTSDPELEQLFYFFEASIDISVVNLNNTGAVYSRVLYLPEIKELWLQEPINKEFAIGESAEQRTDEEDLANSRERSIEATIHSDLFSDEDLLNYNSYARSISRFLTHRNTKPPLTIGILAPWGKGKTTLMKLIQKNLKEILNQPKASSLVKTNEKEVQTTYGQFLDYLREKVTQLMTVQKLQFPTIWFNAWNFQKNEQVWAGFANEIINQLIGQLPAIEQEKAWLALHLRRINRKQLRAKVHKMVLNRLFPAIGAAALSLFAILLAFIFKQPLPPGMVPTLLMAAPLLTALTFWHVIRKVKSAKLDFDLYKYVRQPNYEDKLGYLHTVKEDLRLALDLLVAADKPAIIFIDDLDRCSPATTTELVEAINSFISGDLPYCYFILGQDAQMVAASLDVTYKEVGEKLGNLQNGYGSLGWFFMEKFMQLQFNIPIMQAAEAKRIMYWLFNGLEYDEEQDLTQSKAAITKEADQLIARIESSDNEIDLYEKVNKIEEKLLQVEPQKLTLIKNKIVDNAARNYGDEDDYAVALIEEFSDHLTVSPRMVKRFVNLYRFYRFIQFTGQTKKMFHTEGRAIAKWIIIMIKWPQLVRAIQWDTEKDFQNGTSPLERATNFEQDILAASTYDIWRASAMDKYKNGSPWLTDRGLFEFLKAFSDNSPLKEAVECRFW